MREARLGLLFFAAIGIVGIVLASSAGTAGSSSECQKAGYHAPNATILDASTQWVDVTGGERLNGSIAGLHFENLDTKAALVLHSPDGWTSEKYVPLNGKVSIPDIPACHTGTWDLVDQDAGETVANFNTTESSDLLDAGSTIQVDYPYDDDPDMVYDPAGKASATVESNGATSTDSWWPGTTTPFGYPATCCANVEFVSYAKWSVELPDYHAFFMTCTWGELLGRQCTYWFGPPTDGQLSWEQEMELSPEWKAGGAYDSSVSVSLYQVTENTHEYIDGSTTKVTVLPST